MYGTIPSRRHNQVNTSEGKTQVELTQIIKILLRRWWLVAIPTVVVAVLVLPDLFRDSPATSGGYNASFLYTAGQQRDAFGPIEGDLQDVWEASFKLVDAFTEWVRTSSFRDEVAALAERDGLNLDLGALGIAADNERAVGQVILGWHDAAELEIIAGLVIEVLQTRNQAYFGPQLGDQSADVIVLDQPVVVAAPPPITDRFGPLIRLMIGVVVGLALAFLVDYLDPTVRDRDALRAAGLRVVASIPRGRAPRSG